jgi:hypothetical protein
VVCRPMNDSPGFSDKRYVGRPVPSRGACKPSSLACRVSARGWCVLGVDGLGESGRDRSAVGGLGHHLGDVILTAARRGVPPRPAPL